MHHQPPVRITLHLPTPWLFKPRSQEQTLLTRSTLLRRSPATTRRQLPGTSFGRTRRPDPWLGEPYKRSHLTSATRQTVRQPRRQWQRPRHRCSYPIRSPQYSCTQRKHRPFNRDPIQLGTETGKNENGRSRHGPEPSRKLSERKSHSPQLPDTRQARCPQPIANDWPPPHHQQ